MTHYWDLYEVRTWCGEPNKGLVFSHAPTCRTCAEKLAENTRQLAQMQNKEKKT